jgi:hypothetical protein
MCCVFEYIVPFVTAVTVVQLYSICTKDVQ